MLFKFLRRLQLVYYSVLTYYFPYDFRTIPPKNYLIFQRSAEDRRFWNRFTAHNYLRLLDSGCPQAAGEAVVTKVELMRSSRFPTHEFLICYVKDRRNIHGRHAVIRIERFSSCSSHYNRHTFRSGDSPPVEIEERDYFNIICMPVVFLEDYDIQSTVTFIPKFPLGVEQVAMIATLVSEDAEGDNDPSYPYARLIYNIILDVQSSALKHTTGKAPLEDEATLKRLTQSFRPRWNEYQGKIRDSIKWRQDDILRWRQANELGRYRQEAEAFRAETETLRQETETYQREIERMKQELEVLRKESAELTRNEKGLDDHKGELDGVSSGPSNAP